MKKNAKTVSAIIIATILSITVLMSAVEVKEAKAEQEPQVDWGATVGYPGPDGYSECDHTDWGCSDDCAALIGMGAVYDLTNYPPYAYINATWICQAQVGDKYGRHDYTFYGDSYCDAQNMYLGQSIYNNLGEFTNTNNPTCINGYYAKQTSHPYTFDRSSSVNGQVYASFRDDYWNIVTKYAQPSGYYYQVMTASPGSPTYSGESAINVHHEADVDATPTQSYPAYTGPHPIEWHCADDYGSHYCFISSVDVYDVNGTHLDDYTFPTGPGVYDGSTALTIEKSPLRVVIGSTPYVYPVYFKTYAHNDNIGGGYTLVSTSEPDWRVAWEEYPDPHWSTGTNLNGGGPENYFINPSIDDPWGQGSDYFSYAVAQNWGEGSETNYYESPISVYTFTWGNTVDLYYNWQSSGNYHTVTFQYGDDYWQDAGQAPIAIDGNSGYYMGFDGTQYSLYQGWHELSIPAEWASEEINSVWQDGNQIAGPVYYVWFYVGSDSTINCLYGNWFGRSSASMTDANVMPTPPLPSFPSGFTPPPTTPYYYNATTNTYIPAR